MEPENPQEAASPPAYSSDNEQAGTSDKVEMKQDEPAKGPVAERKIVKELMEKHSRPEKNEMWCCLDAKWWDGWKKYVAFDEQDDEIGSGGSEPGPIDNSDMQESGSQRLKKSLQLEVAFTLVHETVYDKLVGFYGGGPRIARKAVEKGSGVITETVVDLHPCFITWGYANPDHPDQLPKTDEQKTNQIPASYDLATVMKYFNRDAPPAAGGERAPGSSQDVRLYMRLGVLNEARQLFAAATEEDKQRFIEVSPEELGSELEELKLAEGELNLVVAVKNDDNEWTYNTPKPYQFRIGEMYDIKDSRQKHYEGYINQIEPEGKGAQVHYINWASKWDEWVPWVEREERFLERGCHTNGPYKNKKQRQEEAQSRGWSGGGYYNNNQHETGGSIAKGIVGLRNLGNTCFMNSTLQCLFQAPKLTTYFNNSKWEKDLNRANPLGKEGKVAEEYGRLIQHVFSGKYRCVTPRDFKRVIGSFAPRFMGYQQQDSQELLAFLLDGLHEDLNRVKDKPYTKSVDSNGRPDHVVAKESWEVYQKRNNSIIVDLLQGQYKSKLVCPTCNNISITFDPFMYLSVPLPTEKNKTQKITWVGINAAPKKYGIKCLKGNTVTQMKEIIGKQFQVDPKFLIAADIWKNKVHRQCREQDAVQDLRDSDDIWVYNITPKEEPMNIDGDNGPRLIVSEVFHSTRQKVTYSYTTKNFGIPLFLNLVVHEKSTNAHVYKQVVEALKPCMKAAEMGEDEEELAPDDPFTITFAVKEHGFFGRDDHKLTKDGKPLPDLAKAKEIRFNINWEDPARYNARRYVEIPTDDSFPQEDNRGAGRDRVGLSTCMSAFTEEETLSQDNMWYCSKCKEFKMATKKIDLWRVPDLLVIHLKRFSYTRHYRNKITTLVDFPLQDFDIKDWISPSCDLKQGTKYELFGASMHSGGLGGGHYTAYAKSLVEQSWFYLNDSSASSANASDAQSPAAYLLFYQRVGINKK